MGREGQRTMTAIRIGGGGEKQGGRERHGVVPWSKANRLRKNGCTGEDIVTDNPKAPRWRPRLRVSAPSWGQGSCFGRLRTYRVFHGNRETRNPVSSPKAAIKPRNMNPVVLPSTLVKASHKFSDLGILRVDPKIPFRRVSHDS